MLRLCLSLAGFAILLAAIGCGSSEPTSGNNSPPIGLGSSNGPPSGNAVFDKNCRNCHLIVPDTGGGPKKLKGPSLALIGKEHDAAWIATFVKDPSKTKPNAKMPEFGTKLSEEDIKNVSEFLATKK